MPDDSPPNLVLIGYRGCGKTTVGRLLANRLSARFIDTDQEIAARAGMSIADIFASEGEDGFRRRESEVILRLASPGPLNPTDPMVISLGGGAVLNSANMTRLKEVGRVVWLTCSPDVLHSRVATDQASSSSRPALTSHAALEEIRTLLAQREPLYRAYADLEISSQGRPPGDLATEIVTWSAEET